MENSKIVVDTISETSENDNSMETVNSNSTGATPHPINNSKVCTFFAKYKNCRYGKDCKFKHCNENAPEQNGNISFRDRIFVSKSGSNGRSTVKSMSDRKFATKKIICRYFIAGNCDRGDHCLYQHSSENSKYPMGFSNNSQNSSIKKKRVPICHYFKKGNCHRGEDCKFYHSSKLEPNAVESSDEKFNENAETTSHIEKFKDNIDVSTVKENTPITTSLKVKENVVHKNHELPNKFSGGRNLYNVSNISKDELNKLREIEIVQLKKRYPKHTILEQESISFTFEPSDPDWPFDLKSLELEVYFPENYPVEACKINVVLSSNNIPDILIRHLNQSIKDFIEKRFEELKCSSQIELMFRPFLKWFDRNLEDLFICGLRKVKRDIEAKKDGIEFVPVQELFSSSNENTNSESIPFEAPKENNLDSSENQLKNIISDIQSKKHSHTGTLLNNSALKQGIKVLFNGLELVEGIATFSCSKLSITVQCIRCKISCNVMCSYGKSSSVKCLKCSKMIECSFSPMMMHQFSNVAGNLHVIECQIVDMNLVESCFVLDCLNCSKHITIDGLHYGQKQKRWCTSCNEKLIFSIESVKFQATSSTYIAAKNVSSKKVEKRKDALFKEGEPLPDYGTCKHYKKSYRWLRFPCCGRLYPCDICHDEKENDHEMKFASRMICGYCSKEQPYSKDKPCTSCSGSMTAKPGAHWEGGKGCRNKIKMAREDKHKYSGTSKTVSKKAQSTKSGKK